jgi:ubiquinone/menaquinone biosynthesis C-methylase UbiE
MDHIMNTFHFRLMAAKFWFRYRSELPKEAVAEAGIKPGDTVLDFGCGPGGFSVEAARVVGEKGRVYALDIMPLATRYVTRYGRKAGVTNIRTITSGRETGLDAKSVDVILLYDILHHLSEPEPILAELSRVLADDGVLSVSDHHLGDERIIAGITGSGLFRYEGKGARTYTFSKASKRGRRAGRPA